MNKLLVGIQPVGAWLVNFLSLAPVVISAEKAGLIDSALAAATQREIDLDRYLPTMYVLNPPKPI